ncbi:GEVED domain-containing protein, partial [Flavobacteriaceae bacterium]|nr:GEVED domain-containing protein [Flavobacteriaceae bacterium]
WAFDYWKSPDPFDETYGGNTAGDFSMVYRASNDFPNQVIKSIRSELLREGIQDFEKIRILKSELSQSSNPFDQQRLELLQNWMSRFSKTSGLGAEYLVSEGQKILNGIAASNYGYCESFGTTSNTYFPSYVVTKKGVNNNNIDYYTATNPTNGYARHTANFVEVETGTNFNLEIENSSSSNCANTYVWIDWNEDLDFQDEGELVYSTTASTCNSPIQQNMTINIPQLTKAGTKRIRVRTIDKNINNPSACQTISKSSTLDLDLIVRDNYCLNTSNYNTANYFITELETEGCSTNINYNTSVAPLKNYTYYTENQIDSQVSNTFFMNFSLSENSNCARPNIWVDWNQDGDFNDTDEKAFQGGNSETCSNSLNYSVPITVPSHASSGTTRMRIMVKDSWLTASPCDMDQAFSTVDFEINIASTSNVMCAPLLTYPIENSTLTQNETFTWNANNDDIDEFELIISSIEYGQSNPTIHYSETFSGSTFNTLIANILPKDGRVLNVVLKSKLTSGSTVEDTLMIYAPDTYCISGGGIHQGYFLQKLQTVNGQENINFLSYNYPNYGYLHYVEERLVVDLEETISFQLKNSGGSFCGVTSIYIDWNNDTVFDEATELVHKTGTAFECKNPLKPNFDIVVPPNAKLGLTRMRIIVRDAWKDTDICGKLDHSSTTDFDIDIKQNYCETKGSDANYEYIESVSINGTNFQTGNNNGYLDNTETTVDQLISKSLSLTLTPGFLSTNYNENWFVWIDFDKDGVFDNTNELVYTGRSQSSIATSIAIPSQTQAGETTMRVMMKYLTPSADPCGTFTYGEVEDYRLNLIQNDKVEPNYCETKGSDANYEYIESVSINGTNFQTGNNNGYFDNTETTVDQLISKSLSLTLTPGFLSTNYNENWFVWIDFDKDGVFDNTNELVYTGRSQSSIATSIAIPSQTQAGETTMRVMMKYLTPSADPCGTFTYGEVEDYKLNFNGNLNSRNSENNKNEVLITNNSLDDQASLSVLTLYPNPVSKNDDAFIKLPTNTEYKEIEKFIYIYDIYGKRIHNDQLINYIPRNHSVKFNFKNYGAGLYIIKIKTNNNWQRLKIILK